MRTTFTRQVWTTLTVLGVGLTTLDVHPSAADEPEETPSQTLLFFRATPDAEQQGALGQYFQGARPLAVKAGSVDLLQRPVVKHLAGRLPAAIFAISQFPNEEAARGFFERSTDYQQLVPIRDKAFAALDIFLAAPGAPMTNVEEGTSLVAFVAAPNPKEMEALARYRKASQTLATQANVNLIVQRPVSDQLVGSEAPAMLAVAEFSSRAAVTAFFESSEYKALLPDRERAFTEFDIYLLGDQ